MIWKKLFFWACPHHEPQIVNMACMSYISVVVIKYHDQKPTYGRNILFRFMGWGIGVYHGREAWWQEADTLHLRFNHEGESKMEMVQDWELLKPSPRTDFFQQGCSSFFFFFFFGLFVCFLFHFICLFVCLSICLFY